MKRLSITFLSPLLTPFRLVFFFLAAPPLLLATLLFLTLDSAPISQQNWTLTRSDMLRAKMIVGNSASKEQKTITLNKKDLNIALSYLLNYYTHSTSLIEINDQSLHFKIALRINNDGYRRYVNLSFSLNKHHGYPVINALQVGKIKIADEFAGLFLESLIKYTPLKDYYILAAQHIKNIHIQPEGLRISYLSSADLAITNKLSLNNKSYQSILFYQQQITNIIAQHNPKWRLSLAELLQPLFKHAYQRSIEKTAIAENRIVLIVISAYVNKNEIQPYFPFDISPRTLKQYPASMYKRTDMAKHFMVSAVLAANGAETLANILGQEKELNDAKQGSGFSFIDLAGDKAGLRFGKEAVASPSKAKLFQQRIANISDYKALMPDVRDLPENMSNNVFKQQFGSVYSTKYQTMIKKIDQRIANLEIYK